MGCGRPIVNPRMGMLGRGDGGRQARLGDHVQAEYIGRVLGDRGVVDGKIVDEGGARRLMPFDDFNRIVGLEEKYALDAKYRG